MLNKLIKTVCIGILIWVGACHSGQQSADIVLGLESYPTRLDPRYPVDAYSSKVQRLLYNGLLKLNPNLQLVPDLAEAYQYLSDTRLRFQIRPDVEFHNGQALRAQDVAYTLESIRDPAGKSPLFGTFQKIKKIEVIDDLTLEIELKEPFAPFLTALTVGIVPKGSDPNAHPNLDMQPIGTGPFRFDGKKQGQWIRLLANEKYFNSPPLISSLLIETVRDDTTRVLKLLRGELDLVQNAVPLVMASWLNQKSGLQLETDQGINYNYLGFNLKDPILKERRVREAIGMAINRGEIIQYQLRGFARPATGLLAPSNAFYEPNVSRVSYDPERAKRLLDLAGFPDPDGDGPEVRFTLTYKTSNRRDRVGIARAIARYLEKVGIGVDVRPYEWGTFFRDIRTGNFQMYSSTWVGISEPDIYYYVFHSEMIPPNGANRGYYYNEQVDKLLAAARAETDPKVRLEYYSQVQKMLSLELPYISLWYEDNVAFLQPDIMGYELWPNASFIGLTKVQKVESGPMVDTAGRQ